MFWTDNFVSVEKTNRFMELEAMDLAALVTDPFKLFDDEEGA
jgi:hypothetical protein